MNKISCVAAFFIISLGLKAQNDSTTNEIWSYHFQLTSIQQGHPKFTSAFSGKNSLQSTAEKALSVTTTLFLGRKLWKGAALYFNPEISGGRGISEARGIAGFTNGETFRIGDAAPALYTARLYFQQIIPLKTIQSEFQKADANQIAGNIPTSRVVITAGKFALSDYFDDNNYSHDPRTQFMNWSLMSNGAWDYPANTRGYTDGIVVELIKARWALRAASALVPKFANGPDLDYNYARAHSETIELQKNYSLYKRKGIIRVLGFYTVSKAPAYRKVINDYITGTDTSLNVINGKKYGGVKYGFGLNAEQELLADLRFFFKYSWNDGKTATWAFTEIDRSLSFGFSIKGNKWKRNNDVTGIAFVSNGISKDHRDFLNIGGYGFIIGDGKLPHYGHESIAEIFYSSRIFSNLWLSLDYQFVNNPAYNKDRGPVHVFAARGHIEF